MLFRVDEYLDLFPDSVLLVNDPEAETGVSGIQRKEKLGYRLSPDIEHSLAIGVGSQGPGDVYLHSGLLR